MAECDFVLRRLVDIAPDWGNSESGLTVAKMRKELLELNATCLGPFVLAKSTDATYTL